MIMYLLVLLAGTHSKGLACLYDITPLRLSSRQCLTSPTVDFEFKNALKHEIYFHVFWAESAFLSCYRGSENEYNSGLKRSKRA